MSTVQVSNGCLSNLQLAGGVNIVVKDHIVDVAVAMGAS